jgi:hypothetical protein
MEHILPDRKVYFKPAPGSFENPEIIKQPYTLEMAKEAAK